MQPALNISRLIKPALAAHRLAAVLVASLLAVAASAQTLYWDANDQNAGAGGPTPNGTWSTTGGTNALWNTDSGGVGSGNTVNWTSGRDAVFSAGTDATGSYTITVSGTQNVSGITIKDGTPTFTGGTLNFNDATPSLVINSGRILNWGSTILTSTNSSTVNLSGGGTLNFTADQTFAGTVNISGGTLRLTTAALTLTTLNVTSNTTIDFAGTASSLTLTNLTISAGVTLTITNWANATDYFYTTNWTGASFNTTGSTPMNQVVFNGFTGANTKWQSYDHQITPVPEPAAYGAILFGALASVITLRRRRSHRTV
jgi:autotransporter-associated beta strand protein